MDGNPRRRLRSEVKLLTEADEKREWKDCPLNGKICSTCYYVLNVRSPQRTTPCGDICESGEHGGVEGLNACPHFYLKVHGADSLCPDCKVTAGDPPLFVDAAGKEEKPYSLPVGFVGIIESMVVIDVHASYMDLRHRLKCGEAARNDKGKLREALDEAEDSARQAHLLYCNACIEETRYEIESASLFAAMWKGAVEELEDEVNGTAPIRGASGRMRAPTKKSITNDDVKSRCAINHPRQWDAHHMGAVRVKVMVEHLKELSDQWSQRCRTLEVLLSSAR